MRKKKEKRTEKRKTDGEKEENEGNRMSLAIFFYVSSAGRGTRYHLLRSGAGDLVFEPKNIPYP
jgi:hypothetical protein